MSSPTMTATLDVDHSTDPIDDPFVTNSQQQPQAHRFSAFDTQLFDLNGTSSPTQAKRALEAHLAETERRLQETSKLGTNLVNQRARLSEKLKEVEKQQNEAEIGPELRQKLVELEREYNEVGRDSARAFLAPKSRMAFSDDVSQSGGPHSGSVTYSSQATASPTKVSVPSRTQRNKPSSKIDNIEFATEISTSLLAQVRQLQALLAERDETLKGLNLEKSRLELEAEGFTQRIKALDESEQRYKDENWSLETQTHELMATAKEAAEKEKKLTTALNAASSEKQTAQRELDELRQSNSKLAEEHTAKQKAHDTEVHTLRRNLASGDTERSTLQRRVEELTSQNTELAKAVAARFRQEDPDSIRDTGSGTEDTFLGRSSPEHSPPPSPSKGTPRHNHLESETLRSSLHHAHRMIQSLKGNIHREKTEKMELKRMLQEARDELELRRGEPGGAGSANKRQKTRGQDGFKKPARPGTLGASRVSRTEYELDEPDWEDQVGEHSPSQAAASRYLQVDAGNRSGNPTDVSDAYQTANETEDAFETANERETESEAFQTGAESLAGESSDELTETERSSDRQGTVRGKKPVPITLAKPGNRTSFHSTASTSAGEEDEEELKTPIQNQMPRYRLKMGRNGGSRRSRILDDNGGTPGSNRDSPASLASNRSPPVQGGQSLFAELGGLNGEGEDEFGTPGKSSVLSNPSTPGRIDSMTSPATESPAMNKAEMVDCGMQTDAWEPSMKNHEPPAADVVATQGIITPSVSVSQQDQSTQSVPEVIDSSTQYTPQKPPQAANLITPPKTTWDDATEKSLSPGRSAPATFDAMAQTRTAQLTLSSIHSENTAPDDAPDSRVPLAPLTLSNINVQQTTPATPATAVATPSTPVLTRSDDADSRPKTAEKVESKSAIFGSFFGRKGRRGSQPSIAEDETSTPRPPTQSSQTSPMPFREISTNTGSLSNEVSQRSMEPAEVGILAVEKTDQGAQTILSSDQIDQLLMEKNRPRSAIKDAPMFSPTTVITPPRGQRSKPPSQQPELLPKDSLALQNTPRRPGSAGSHRMSSSSHPPLPPHHRQAIEAARVSSSGTANSSMGPPIAPASAMRANSRLSQRSGDQVQSPTSKAGTTPRARRTRSITSRRSSVSSFASELDERFNIRPNEYNMPEGLDPGTDPRMIQAITQTMIGEFLWKYTRKAGRPDMSSTRHRRYFWVHPYTRTLYWSDQDPQSAGRNELKAKSVPIEAVRVISDDNPMPPGLHRKSLEVITPARKIKFTAPTGQRHETWFNALSYLLLRTNGPQENEPYTAEDVSEFNPRMQGTNGRTSRATAATAASLSSYNSRTTQNTTVHRTTPAARANLANSASSSTAQQDALKANDSTIRQGSMSRLSSMFTKPATVMGSFSSRRSRVAPGIDDRGNGSIYDASLVHDSTEELTQPEPENEGEGLENVRACCDGKHDVSSLSHKSRHGSTAARHHSHGGVTSMGARTRRH